MRLNVSGQKRDVVVIAASAGSLAPLGDLCGALSPDVPAGVVVVFHRSAFSESHLVSILQRRAAVPVVEPSEGEPFTHGMIFIAPRDRHLLLGGGAFHLNRGPKQHHLRPAADPLFCSAAEAFGERVLALVLSGAGFDGASGCVAVKARGGVVITQAPDEAAVPYMPMHTIAHDHVDASVRLQTISEAIAALAAGRAIDV